MSLFDLETGKDVWTESYDMMRGEVVNVVDRVVAKIAELLKFQDLSLQRSISRPVPDAYDSYLHGLYYRDKFTKDDIDLGIEYFSDAIKKDSTFTKAMVSLADAKAIQA